VSDPNLTVAARIPDALRAAVASQLARASEEDVAGRIAREDVTLWGPSGTPEIANRLGWLTIAQRMLGELGALELFAAETHDDELEDVVLLGMGGSSLAPEVLRRSFAGDAADPAARPPHRARLHVLDSTDAARIRAIESTVDLRRTLFVVSSKSGGTIEPLSLFAHFFSLVQEEGNRFVAITDPGSGLEALAAKHAFRRTFAGDPNIGGRYSALSAFGIVPGALTGDPALTLLEGAPTAWETGLAQDAGSAPGSAGDSGAGDSGTAGDSGVGSSGSGGDADSDGLPAAVWLGAALSGLAQAGRDKLTFVISETLPGLGLWLEQLVAESTGKHGTGVLPVADEPLGEPAVYGDDRVFAYLPDVHAPDAELERKVQALAEAGHPVFTIPTTGPEDLGRVFLLAEIAVAVIGWGLQINPFDQPNVQQAKDATNRVLAGYEAQHELPEIADADDAALRALLWDASPPSYVAIMGYLQPSPEFDAAAAELRETIRAQARATTTFGYGPRFLHSTGQFHKGGPKTGRFLQLIHDGPEDVEIPGKPFTFTTLKNAQAIGDLETLRSLELPAERVRLRGEDPAQALRALTAKIKEML
jgi:transaldolase / glucose-6-phosphate isomerase